MESSKKSPRVVKKTASGRKGKRISQPASEAASTLPAIVNSVKKDDKGKSKKNVASDADGPESPTIVINRDLTAGKLRLLQSSPLRDILSKNNEKSTDGNVASAESGESQVGDKKRTAMANLKGHKAKVANEGSADFNVRCPKGKGNVKSVGTPNKPKIGSKSAPHRLAIKSKTRLSTSESASMIEFVSKSEAAAELDSQENEKVISEKQTASLKFPNSLNRKSVSMTPSPVGRSIIRSQSEHSVRTGPKGISGNRAIVAKEASVTQTEANVDAEVGITNDLDLEKSAIDSYVNNLLNPVGDNGHAEDRDDAAPVTVLRKNDDDNAKQDKGQKRRRERNRANKRSLLRKITTSTGTDAGSTDGNKKGSVGKVIKKYRGDGKKVEQAKKGNDDQDNPKKVSKIGNTMDDGVDSDNQNTTPGVMYIGHIPHGFYEKQMAGFFSQFGRVLRVRVSRSWRTGKSSGFAFVKFADKDVAVIASEAMDGYLMHGKRLKANFIPAEKVHKDMFKPKTRSEKFTPISVLERRNLLKRSRNPQKVAARSRSIKKEISRKKKRLERLGMCFAFPDVVPSSSQHHDDS